MIDAHTHLSSKNFDTDRDTVIENSIKSGVKEFIEVLCSCSEWQQIRYFEKYYQNFYFSLGIHPHYFKEYSEDNIKELEKLINSKRIIAVGETGIDLWYHPQNLKEQIELMLKQIEIANTNNKILVFHIRNPKNSSIAYDEFFNVTKDLIKVKSIIHSFSGNYEDAKKALERGFYIGINATITYPKNTELRETIKKTGLTNILTETDSPYLAPQRIRGHRNDPTSIMDIIKVLSEILNKNFKEVEEEIELNFKKLITDLNKGL
jgi:TatD DNase family protein